MLYSELATAWAVKKDMVLAASSCSTSSSSSLNPCHRQHWLEALKQSTTTWAIWLWMAMGHRKWCNIYTTWTRSYSRAIHRPIDTMTMVDGSTERCNAQWDETTHTQRKMSEAQRMHNKNKIQSVSGVSGWCLLCARVTMAHLRPSLCPPPSPTLFVFRFLMTC